MEHHFRGHTNAFDHFEVALVPTLFYLPPAYAVALAGIAKLVVQVHRHVQPTRAAFNIAQWSAAAGAGALTLRALSENTNAPDVLSLAVASLVLIVVNKAAVVCVLTLAQDGPVARNWRAGTASLLSSTAAASLINVTFGVLFVLAKNEPVAAVLLLVPFAVLHWASRGYAMERLEQLRIHVTSSATTALAAEPDADRATANFLAVVGDMLNRDAVELVTTDADGLQVHQWRRGSGATPPATVSRDDLGSLVRLLLARDRPVRSDTSRGDAEVRGLLRRSGHRDCAAAPLAIQPGGPTGVLVLYDARKAVALPDAELAIIAELAREVGLARQVARLGREVLEERAKMTQIVTETADGILTLGPDGIIHTWNPALERVTGYAANEVVGVSRVTDLDPVDAEGAPLALAAWQSRLDFPRDVLVRTKSGDRRWLACSYAPATHGSGTPDRLIVMARDVTELRRAQARLRGQTAVLELIAGGADVEKSLLVLAEDLTDNEDGLMCAVLLTDPGERSRLEIAALSRVTATTLAELDGLTVSPTAGWPGRAAFRRQGIFVDDVLTDPESDAVLPMALAHGVRSCSAVPIMSPDGEHAVGVIAIMGPGPRPDSKARDRKLLERATGLAAVAVARSQFESRLAHQATHDSLTGLPNRAVLLEHCELSLASDESQGGALMLFLDLDRFKLVNDSMGHDAGDQLLVEIAHRLRRVSRPEDTVSRFGGDEFAVLCVGVHDEGLVHSLAERVQRVFIEPFTLRGTDVIMTTSIGVARAYAGTDAEDLMRMADAAMYRAKARGGNRYELYSPSMRAPALQELATHSALHQALEGGQLRVYYQPIVSLESRAVIGVEALVRWAHPQRGLLIPDAFLTLAENTGLIVPIGHHVMAAACRQARTWSHAGPGGSPLTMNINLSARELGQGDLARTVARVLQQTGADPAAICFEITESALLQDVATTAEVLTELKALGVRLAIDDFGTGYSALTHLRQFPVDGLKIDRSFVAGLDSADDHAIVSAVIGLAQSMQLTVVAEGVETEEHVTSLRDLGCDAGQGFFFASAAPAEEIMGLWDSIRHTA